MTPSTDTVSASARHVALAVTGASGAPYALRVLEALLRGGHTVHAVVTDAGARILTLETDLRPGRTPRETAACLEAYVRERARARGDVPGMLRVYAPDNVAAPVASGSFACAGMVVVPCSMGTLGRIASGISSNLVERAADVMLKERRPLVLVPRETPLSDIHLENMLRLRRAGADILPAMPGFYHRPRTIDDLVDMIAGRVLDRLGIANALAPRWGGGGESRDDRQDAD